MMGSVNIDGSQKRTKELYNYDTLIYSASQVAVHVSASADIETACRGSGQHLGSPQTRKNELGHTTLFTQLKLL